MVESKAKTKEFVCPYCCGSVQIYDKYKITLKNMQINPNMSSVIHCSAHRYHCNKFNKTFSEEIPFKYPINRITNRAANWIKAFLYSKISVRSIQNLTGIYCDTIIKYNAKLWNIN